MGRRAAIKNGFTLIEVLVALAILSLALVALYGVLGDSAHRLARARAESGAVTIAQGKLDEVGLTIPPTIGDTSGTAGGFAWHLSIAAFGTPEDRVAWPVTVLELTARVTWSQDGTSKSLKLHTLKIVPKG